jgi:hypothetical protein
MVALLFRFLSKAHHGYIGKTSLPSFLPKLEEKRQPEFFLEIGAKTWESAENGEGISGEEGILHISLSFT